MGARVVRTFLGWKRSFLQVAVEAWIERVRAEKLDSARALIALPGRRAARRVEDRIAELAPSQWTPPKVVSEGELAQVLRKRRALLATDWQCDLAWREALSGVDTRTRESLWGARSGTSTQGLARLCSRVFRELAADDVSPAEVAARAEASRALGSASVWRAYAEVEARYRAALDARGVIDPSASAQSALAAELDPSLRVFLLSVVDPPQALRRLLGRLSDVEALVFAPEAESAHFDDWGFLDVEHWSERDPGISTERWQCVDSPDDEAKLAVAHLASIQPRPAPEQVAVGLADLSVRPFLERRLIELGCEPRFAGGTPLTEAPAARLVLGGLRWAASRSAEDFALLARHPDFEALCGVPGGTLSAALDTFLSEHSPLRMDGHWPESSSRGGGRALDVLRAAVEKAQALFGSADEALASSVKDWSARIRALISAAYPAVASGARDKHGWLHVRALEALARQVADLAMAPAAGSASTLAGSDVAQLIEEHLEALELPPPPPGEKLPLVEIFGWLELALDDAPHLAICGLNEGALPARGTSGGLLSDPARRALGLLDERRRAARDVWALAAILAGRPSTLLLSARRDAERNPLVPSRFLFRGGPDATLARIQHAFPEHESAPPPASGSPERRRPQIGAEPAPTTISVTEFRRYLESPFLYYVGSVLKRRSAGYVELELDPRAFGTFAHEVLSVLGEPNLRGATDVEVLRTALSARLDALSSERFGNDARPAVWLQVEKLRTRLERVARWQAAQATDGWVIVHTELKTTPRELRSLLVTGTIDRIEQNRRTGRWRISDYKTGDKPEKPGSVHGKPGKFKDLQLPLYYWLAEPLHGGQLENVELGYITVSKEESSDLFAKYSFGEVERDSAMQCAAEVVDAIAQRKFEGLPKRAPLDRSLAYLCGFGLLSEEDSDDEDEVEGEA